MDHLYSLLLISLEPILYLNDAGKRIYWLYLLASAVIAIGVLVASKKDVNSAFRYSLSTKLWFNPSSLMDFKWFFVNSLIATVLIAPIIGGQLSWALSLNRIFISSFGEGNMLQWPVIQVSILFTVIFFLAEDFSRFLMHYLYHKIAFLWRFHAIHHSADILTPITLYRIHSVELFLNSLRSVFIAGSISGLFIYLFDTRIALIDILGANIFTFIFNMAGSNLRHSHIWLGYGPLERLFVSPAQHQIHHSSEARHIDTNFGATLSIWDALFRSRVFSHGESVQNYGLYKQKAEQNFKTQWKGLR